MRIPLFMHETNTLEELSGEGLHIGWRKAYVFVLLDDIVKRWSEQFEYQTKVVVVVKTLIIAH